MLYAGLDLSRKRLDVHLLDEEGATKEVTAVSPDADALRTLVASTARHGEPVRATIESMAVSPTGDRVYVTGVATVDRVEALGTIVSVQFDISTVAYDASTGEREWVSLSGFPGDLHERGHDVAVSPDGRRVYATGYASRMSAAVIGGNGTILDTPADVVTLAHEASDGSRLWVGRFNSRAGGLAPERGGAVVVGPDGRRVFVAGYLNHVTFDPTGERRTAWFGSLSYEA